MKTKLTLTIEQKVVRNTKEYARRQGRSLSDLVEYYLRAITDQEEQETVVVAPFVRSVHGGTIVPDDFHYDYKKVIKDGLSEYEGRAKRHQTTASCIYALPIRH